MEKDPGVHTPRRKRARRDIAAATTTTTTPTRSSPGNGVRGNAKDDGVRVVWRDSPAEKQIRVSGTGKLAQQEEVQGFVGRLARASVESLLPGLTPTHARDQSTDSDDEYDRKKKANGENHGKRSSLTRLVPVAGLEINPPLAETSCVSRHILFSPEAVGKTRSRTTSLKARSSAQQSVSRQSARTGESQDELTLLDQLDERLSRETEEPILNSVQQATDTQSMTASTAPASSTFATPPRLTTKLPESSVTQVTPPVVVQQKLEFESPDFTEESWELLDQLEFEASQQIASRQNGGLSQTTQSQYTSHQVLPPAPPHTYPNSDIVPSTKPLVSPSTKAYPMVVTSDKSGQGSASPSVDKRLTFEEAVTTSTLTKSINSHPTSEDSFKRLLVLEVDRDPYHRRVFMRLLDDEENHVEIELAEDWYDTVVDAGDTVHLILSEQDRSGFFSQAGSQASVLHKPAHFSKRVVVDNDRHLIIVHPDILVSPTSVTTSFGCLRRAILRETLNVSRPTNQKALLGTLKHELFQRCLVSGQKNVDKMLVEARQIVAANVLQLIESNLSEETAMLELGKVMQDYSKWLGDSRSGGVQLNEPPSLAPPTNVLVYQILAVEEMMWSIKWGLKGATDASVQATFSSMAEEVVLPLELKTGSKAYGGVEHQGQVILYTLMLNERYQQRCQDGLLMYAPGIETNRISAMASHTRGLIIARNKFAAAMGRVKAMGSATSSQQQQVLPPMLRRRDCERCFQVDECVLHHAAVENGTSESSALDDLFQRKVGHLGDADLSYFRKWNRLIDLEHQNVDKHLRALWLQTGTKRERDPDCVCIARLRLISDDPAPRGSAGSATMRLIRFQRDKRGAGDLTGASFLESRFRSDDRVILSVESIDEKKLLVHVARGRLAGLASDSIAIETFQGIPGVVLSGRSIVGSDYTWRVDKDAIASGLSRAKENLVKLFSGAPPEEITSGTSAHLRDLLSSGISQIAPSQSHEPVGDMRRRKLIVHLQKPRFRSSRLADLLRQRHPSQQMQQHDVSERVQELEEAFSRLNIDQQRAVMKVLNSLDYALILGMPGTGKTSTIAFTVKVLAYLGFSVLITSYTHSAVDNLLIKLLDSGIPMIRVGSSKQVHPQLIPHTLEHSVGDGPGGVMSVQGVENRIKEAVVVGSTCLGVNNHVLFTKRRFDYCIVDEATQTTEPVVLGPLRCADTFVLVGDHYQLPPLVANPQAKKEGMDVSLFRRLSEAHPEATQQLSYQYRMNRDIMLVANRLVYADKLKCGSNAVSSNLLQFNLPTSHPAPKVQATWPVQVLRSREGVQFLNTDGVPGVSEASSHGVTGRGRKLENVVEARVVAVLVQVLVAAGVKPEEIAVISPFRAQVSQIIHQIRLLMGHVATQCVEVSTIDKYQGKDKDVVLVSFVRCNAEHNVGELLTDWRRINVALTRAKQKLVLVGSMQTLQSGSSLFHTLGNLVYSKGWEFRLPATALGVLDEVATTLQRYAAAALNRSRRLVEPEPEVEPVVMMHRHATSDIESLVAGGVPLKRLTSRAPGDSRHVNHPITNDIMGEHPRR